MKLLLSSVFKISNSFTFVVDSNHNSFTVDLNQHNFLNHRFRPKSFDFDRIVSTVVDLHVRLFEHVGLLSC